MNKEVNIFHNVLCVCRSHVQVVHRQIVPQVASWVKARSLKTAQLSIISLPVCNLISLVNVCCVVNPVRNIGVLPKTGHMKGKISHKCEHLQFTLSDFNSHKINSYGDAQHSLRDIVKYFNREVLSNLWIGKVSIKASSVVKCLKVVKVGHSASLTVMPRVLFLAPVNQRNQGAEIGHHRSVTSLMILQMVYLLTETPDEVENKVVELVIFKLIHLLN